MRGTPELVERAVFEVPADVGTVSDVQIAGEPILFGGQLAERITVKLSAKQRSGPASPTGRSRSLPVPAPTAGNPWMVSSTTIGAEAPLGTVPDLRVSPGGRRLARPPAPRATPTPTWSRAS